MPDEVVSKEEFAEIMLRNKFIVMNGRVVCDLCSDDCGQCGAGGWMSVCQRYIDKRREDIIATRKWWQVWKWGY